MSPSKPGDLPGPDSTGPHSIGPGSTGPDSTGPDSTGPDSTGTVRERPDLRLLPAAAAVWLVTGLTLGLASPWLWLGLAAALVVAAVAAGLRRWAWVALMLAAAAGFGAVGVAHRVTAAGGFDQLAEQRAVAHVTVRLTSDVILQPRRGVHPEWARAPAVALGVDARGVSVRGRGPLRCCGRVSLVASGPLARQLASYPAGTTVTVWGRLAPDEQNPLTAAQVRVTSPPEVVQPPRWPDRLVNRIRGAVVGSMVWSSPDQAGLVPSLVVGDTSGLPDQVVDNFKATGLTHLTAVSGSNLTLLVVFLLTVCRWLGVRGRWLWLAQGLAVAGFVVLCRAEPSVIRAAAMGLVSLAALGRGRSSVRGVRHLCVAVLLVLLISPELSRSWGFALSVAATAGIVCWGPRLLRAASWLPRGLAEALVVPMAAQLATTPVVVALAGTISLSGLFANVVVAPFVGPSTVLGVVAGMVGSIWQPGGAPFGWAAGWCTQPLLLTAAWGAALPGGVYPWPSGVGPLLILVVTCLAAAWLLPRLLRRPLALLLAFAVLVAAVARPPVVPGWPGPWQVVFCSVGQGDATVIRAGPHSAIVVDTGPEPQVTDQCLTALGVSDVPLLVLTHYHADHVGGLDAVLQRRVGLVITSGTRSPEAMAAAMERRVGAAGVPIRAVAAGEQFIAGQAEFTILASPVGSERVALASDGESSAENDSSVVGIARSGGLTVLLPGDVEPAGQAEVVASGRPLGAMVVKMPHHGSSRQDEQFWKATGARIAVASAGLDNDYGHPSPKAIALAHRFGMQVLRTDTQGSIALRLAGDRIEVRTVS